MNHPSTNTPKPLLAAALIVKNEAEHLRDCLATVADWVDEIVIVDSGSTDATLAIAAEFNARVIIHTDWQGFGAQRRLAQRHVQAEWILWLDADERITPELRDEIQTILRDPPLNTLYAMPRLSWAFGKFIRHSGWYPGYVVRLYPTLLASYDDALVHEKVVVPDHAQVHHLKENLLHYTHRNVAQYLRKMAHYSDLWAQQRQARGAEGSLLQACLHAVGCFVKMYIIKAGFLDGAQGFILAIASAYATFTKYADLWIRTPTSEPQ